MPSPRKLSEVLKRLQKYDARFIVDFKRGKGSHLWIEHPDINGRREALPLPSTRRELHAPYLKQLIRRFDLPNNFFD